MVVFFIDVFIQPEMSLNTIENNGSSIKGVAVFERVEFGKHLNQDYGVNTASCSIREPKKLRTASNRLDKVFRRTIRYSCNIYLFAKIVLGK